MFELICLHFFSVKFSPFVYLLNQPRQTERKAHLELHVSAGNVLTQTDKSGPPNAPGLRL